MWQNINICPLVAAFLVLAFFYLFVQSRKIKKNKVQIIVSFII